MILLDYVSARPLPESFRYTLDDGTPALVRHLRPEDAARLKQGFRKLSSLARRRRFHEDLAELTDAQLRKLVSVDQADHFAWGAIDLNRPEEPGIGVARYRRLKQEPDAADVRITVLDEYMGRGAGVMLHAAIHRAAAVNGIGTFYYDVLADNERFIRHLRALGAEFVGRVVNVTRLKLPVFDRAIRVPHHKPNGRRFAQAMRRLAAVEPYEPVEEISVDAAI